MGWLHAFNLKRKVSGVLLTHRGESLSAAAVAAKADAEEAEVTQLLNVMVQTGFASAHLQDGRFAYRLNEQDGTVRTISTVLEDKNAVADAGMTLRQDRFGWTAELTEPAGLLVRGQTREEARERGRALMEKMSGSPAVETPQQG